MFTQEEIKQILQTLDQEEAKMRHQLANLEQYGTKTAYKAYARACNRTRRHIAKLRKILNGWY